MCGRHRVQGMRWRAVVWGVCAWAALGWAGCAEEDATLTRRGLDVSSPTGGGTVGAPEDTRDAADGPDADPTADSDEDGISDEEEAADAARLLPAVFGALADDPCPTAALLYRASPHPDALQLRVLRGVLVFEATCAPLAAATGHAAAFALTYDPAARGAGAVHGAMIDTAGVCAVRDACEACAETAAETGACAVGGDGVLRLDLSAASHRLYLSAGACEADLCSGPHACGAQRLAFAALNVGEPDAPATDDLTAAGLITAANGWDTPALLDHDPWGGAAFGAAGALRDHLTLPAPAPCP